MLNLRTAVIELDGGPIWMLHVRFGSKADMCAAKGHVRFTPNSDRECGFPQRVMSALPPIADMCSALAHVRFGPKADKAAFCSAKVATESRLSTTVMSALSATFSGRMLLQHGR